MTNPLAWAALVPLLPLLAACLVGLRLIVYGTALSGDDAEPLTARLSSGAALLALLVMLGVCSRFAAMGWPTDGVYLWLGQWFAGTGWMAQFSLMLDTISLGFASLICLIGWVVMRFSANYLHREAGFHRFYLLLNVFLAGMLLIVLAGNALLAFVGWEMCGVASFLLIGFARHRPVATGNALFAFVTNRAGDAGFLLALGLSAAWLGSFEWPVLNSPDTLSMVNARLLLIGLVFAALVKSAQLPFTPWIARALEGPTPSSAIFYGAVMIHAGVFLLLRLTPLLQQVPDIGWALIGVGVLTALYAWLVGLVQTDIKSALIYATVFQVGLMVAEIGAGWTGLAFFHLCTHAMWRTWQFLMSPSWLTLTQHPAGPPPRWLAGWQWGYTAALQRFWLDKLGLLLLLKPTLSFAQDVRGLEADFIDRLIGQPGQGRAVAEDKPLIRVDGVPGQILAALSGPLEQIENRLLLRERGGLAERFLRQGLGYLQVVEHLLEQPRYLMMAVMATFVVIL